MLAPNVGVSSQDARVTFIDGGKPDEWAQSTNDALILVRDDIQRLAGRIATGTTTTVASGNYRLCVPADGILQVYAVSDTATAGSTGAAYHVLAVNRNGVAPLTQTYDTRQTEVYAYLGGVYLGEVTVSRGDVITVSVAVTGAPAPTLSTANFCILSTLRWS